MSAPPGSLLERLDDVFPGQAEVFEDVGGFAAALGDFGDVEGFEGDFVAAGGDGGGDFGVEAAGVVVFDGDEAPAAAGGELEDAVDLEGEGVGVDDGGLAAALRQLVGGLQAL